MIIPVFPDLLTLPVVVGKGNPNLLFPDSSLSMSCTVAVNHFLT
jgi:hypothetical protein